MGTIAMFFFVIMAIVFFLLGIVFNTISSVISALSETVVYIISVAIFVIVSFIVVKFLNSIIANQENLLQFIGVGVLCVIVVLVALGIIYEYGGELVVILVGIVCNTILSIINLIHMGTKVIAMWCEKRFFYFIKKIEFQLEQM